MTQFGDASDESEAAEVVALGAGPDRPAGNGTGYFPKREPQWPDGSYSFPHRDGKRQLGAMLTYRGNIAGWHVQAERREQLTIVMPWSRTAASLVL